MNEIRDLFAFRWLPANISFLHRSGHVAHRDREAMSHKISLVVDDESSVRKLIMAVLQTVGFQTIEAVNGVHALEVVRTLDTAVDLLVSDIQMPKMYGIALAASVRAEFPAIPVILVSGYSDIQQANRHHAFEFVPKPFLPATLRQAVKKVMLPKSTPPSE